MALASAERCTKFVYKHLAPLSGSPIFIAVISYYSSCIWPILCPIALQKDYETMMKAMVSLQKITTACSQAKKKKKRVSGSDGRVYHMLISSSICLH